MAGRIAAAGNHHGAAARIFLTASIKDQHGAARARALQIARQAGDGHALRGDGGSTERIHVGAQRQHIVRFARLRAVARVKHEGDIGAARLRGKLGRRLLQLRRSDVRAQQYFKAQAAQALGHGARIVDGIQ